MTPPRPPLEEALTLAREATNGWACYATRKIELDDIARLHREIDTLKAESLAAPSVPAPDTTTEAGWALRRKGTGGYFDMNGIGDWSLAGETSNAELFPSKSDAHEALTSYLSGEESETEIVYIERTITVRLTSPPEGQ